MTELDDADLGGIFDPDELAVAATYGGDRRIFGIFRSGYAEADVGLGIAGVAPRFWCKASDVDDDPAGKSLAIGDEAWVILRGEPAPSGTMRLVLRRA